jgi:hypothetical protein
VQLKGRLVFEEKYRGKNIWICFPYKGKWYLFPHDAILKKILPKIKHTKAWKSGGYNFPKLSAGMLEMLKRYCLSDRLKT